MHKKKIDTKILLVLLSFVLLFAHAVGAGIRDHNEEKERLEQFSTTLKSTVDFTSPENTDTDLFLDDFSLRHFLIRLRLLKSQQKILYLTQTSQLKI